MGMAAGLIRQRSDEETSQTILNCHHRWHSPIQDIFKVGTVEEWKMRVDFCSLLILSLPLLSLFEAHLPYLPRLGLLANVLFVLPQLVVITGFATFLPFLPLIIIYQQDSLVTRDTLLLHLSAGNTHSSHEKNVKT